MDKYTDTSGKKYIAVTQPLGKIGSCRGCAFYLRYKECLETPECTDSSRADKRNIIWVEKVETQ